MLDKTFDPREVEGRLYAQWEASGAFRAGRRPDAETFCIVIPPPNITGRLHIGHALNNTLQDALARFERMRGKDVLWQTGTDHAGIATQLVVERQLAERQQSRVAMGREKFLEAHMEMEGRVRRRHRAAAAPARRVVRLDARALHDGRGPVARGAQGLRRAAPPGPDLQGQAARQLGPAAADGRLGSRSREHRDEGPSLVPEISDRGPDGAVHHRRHDAPRDDVGRHRRRGASPRSALHGAHRQSGAPAARQPSHSDHRRRRIPTRRKARAR